MSKLQTFQHILLGLSAVLLFCALKNYLAFLVSGTAWCPYLCPSTFKWDILGEAPGFSQLLAAQQWLLSMFKALTTPFFIDRFDLVTRLIAAPVIEEAIYRGPMYLTRSHSRRMIWWLIGMLLAFVFALSHGRSGVALIPLVALGTYNLWLVARTQCLWPAISLHFLYNFFFTSVLLYQAIWVSD